VLASEQLFALGKLLCKAEETERIMGEKSRDILERLSGLLEFKPALL
jgi:hypothetical protein